MEQRSLDTTADSHTTLIVAPHNGANVAFRVNRTVAHDGARRFSHLRHFCHRQEDELPIRL
jgi:hypothetical protein